MEKPKIAIWRYILAVIALWAMTLAGGTMIMYVLALFSPEGALAPILITIFGGAVGVGFGNDLARNCFGQNSHRCLCLSTTLFWQQRWSASPFFRIWSTR